MIWVVAAIPQKVPACYLKDGRLLENYGIIGIFFFF